MRSQKIRSFEEINYELPLDELPDPNIDQILSFYGDPLKTFDFLAAKGLFITETECPYHMNASKQPELVEATYIDQETEEIIIAPWLNRFKCRYKNKQKGPCPFQVSVLKRSFFALRKLDLDEILRIMYYWFVGESITKCHEDFQESVGFKAISNWYQYCNEVCLLDLVLNPPSFPKHPDNIVMIDEVCFGRRKYNRGAGKEHNWVLGIIEMQLKDPTNMDSKERVQVQYLTCYVRDRKELTLLHVIQTFVRPV